MTPNQHSELFKAVREALEESDDNFKDSCGALTALTSIEEQLEAHKKRADLAVRAAERELRKYNSAQEQLEAMQAEREDDDRPHLLPRKDLWARVRSAEEQLEAAQTPAWDRVAAQEVKRLQEQYEELNRLHANGMFLGKPIEHWEGLQEQLEAERREHERADRVAVTFNESALAAETENKLLLEQLEAVERDNIELRSSKILRQTQEQLETLREALGHIADGSWGYAAQHVDYDVAKFAQAALNHGSNPDSGAGTSSAEGTNEANAAGPRESSPAMRFQCQVGPGCENATPDGPCCGIPAREGA